MNVRVCRVPLARTEGHPAAPRVAALKSAADVSVTVPLDTNVKTAISAYAWTTIEYTGASTTNRPAVSPP